MREEDKLLEAISAAKTAGKDAVIATVVRVVGSAYRREGTKMLVDSAGEQVCMISGGCLEAEIGEIAQEVMANREPQTHLFDLSEEVLWGLGLGCGGKVEVYLEPIQETPAFIAWQGAVKAHSGGVLATVLESSVSNIPKTARMFVSEHETVDDLSDAHLSEQVQEVARQKLTSLALRSELRRFGLQRGEVEVFIDVTLPPPNSLSSAQGTTRYLSQRRPTPSALTSRLLTLAPPSPLKSASPMPSSSSRTLHALQNVCRLRRAASWW